MATSLRAFLTVVLLVPWAHGQTAPGTTSRVPVITTSAEEVSLDMVVRDKKNRPILDLKPEDIAVTDNGTPVKISDLRVAGQSANSGHLLTLVFDRLEPSAAKNARGIAAKILKAVPQAGFSFSVLGIDGRLRLFQEFTSDRKALTAAIDLAANGGKPDPASEAAEKSLIALAQGGADPSGAAVSVQERTLAQITLASLQESQKIVQDQHAEPSLAGLLALARTQQKLSGRKVVIYFAQGLQVDSTGKDMLRSIVGAANRSSVSIYAFDANALDEQTSQQLTATVAMGNLASAEHFTPFPVASQANQVPALGTGAAGKGTDAIATDQVGRFESNTLTGGATPLAELAVSTGGSYIGGTDGLKKPLQRLLEDMTTYYEASYVPSIENYDGSFHPIAVKALRPGLVIHARSGYYAMPPGSNSAIRPFEAPLLKILSDPQLPTDLRFNATVLRLGDTPNGSVNELVVEVPLTELDIHEDPNTELYSAHLSIVAQIKKADTVIEHFSEDVPRHGALESLEGARSEVVTLQRHFDAGPGEYVMEAAILDRNSGKAAAQRISFTISNPPTGQSISDMALIRRTEPSRGERDPLEPLQYDKAQVVPNISGHVSHGAKDIALFFIVHPDPKATVQPRLEMEVLKNGEPIGRMPLQLRQTTGADAIPYIGTIRASSFAAGRYEVITSLTQGEKTVERKISFTIEGPAIASAATTRAGANLTGPSGNDGNTVSDTKSLSSGIESHDAGRLIITSTASPTDAPSADAVRDIVEGARERALSYANSLPNFTCVEVTNRSVDHTGTGKWKHRDTMAEKLTYHDHAETRVMLEVNGQRSSTKGEDNLKGTISHGEFGGVLNAVFEPSSKAEFHWKETDMLGSGTVQAFAYSVALENSSFRLTGDNNWQIGVGFHGLVYIDAATRSVRRITLVADNLPRDFSVHSTSISVDYDYIAINAHDYLLPIRGAVSLTQGKREAVLNEFEFRDYRRFGSRTRILGFTPVTESPGK